MLRRKRKPLDGANGLGMLAVPGQTPNESVFQLLGRGFQHGACPVMFEATREDGAPNGLLDDPLGEFSKLGFEGVTIAEAETFLLTIPAASEKATPEELQAAVDRHFKVLR
jgi:hypothetical protein